MTFEEALLRVWGHPPSVPTVWVLWQTNLMWGAMHTVWVDLPENHRRVTRAEVSNKTQPWVSPEADWLVRHYSEELQEFLRAQERLTE